MTRAQRFSKRLFDFSLALVLLPLLLPLMAVLVVVLALCHGRPWFHVQERMKSPSRRFRMWKFRTMVPDPGDHGVSGGHKAARITPLGRVLRRTRADELPQIWNVLRGDMSFVGPRPPLPDVVARFPDLYEKVLVSPPGVTGLATLRFHAREARIMADCSDPAQAQDLYDRRCVPVKARLDLIYLRRASRRFDLMLIWQTLRGGIA
ncbi:sugar transferase [Thioclava marina]|jgi:lipopolysaccharide/colanic/teichoic acid biosynthesis glycosyltransferase|uniref:Sugar transferase n=1 Tax=Thioclava marina TaxID=1915077 RepID=A0ABX3MTD3_9RHOB|nr:MULTISPECIES: sugar transferase [Thioclava]MBD3803882.1 sugar transferase [Thioclava sp.]OOY13534.1 sugar transferase [Thioclava marina]OOY29249.1 sugar transferase [Thioclava sp. L04-15]TNE87358.1 MAG: sugar transferase [Paracoccaceae bacterium]